MSRLNRKSLQKLILKEFKLMGMAPMGAVGDMPLGLSTHSSHKPPEMEDHGHMGAMTIHHASSKGSVSKEDCCKAVLCLIECCECPETKEILRQCCEDILASC